MGRGGREPALRRQAVVRGHAETYAADNDTDVSGGGDPAADEAAHEH